jgi:PhoH-like ATPase
LRGRNSREACRIIDEFRSEGSLAKGVSIGEDGGLFTIYVPKTRKSLHVALDDKSADSAILQCALEIQDKYPDMKSILVTMDINLRIRSESLGMQAASFESDSVDTDTLTNKVLEINVECDELNSFYKNGVIDIDQSTPVNSSIILKSTEATGLARAKLIQGKVIAKKLTIPTSIMGLKPRNVEQKFALDLLLDDDVKLVTLMGIAGTGKSLIALSAALYSIFETKLYQKLLVARPVLPLGKDIGFLPGSADEKLRPYMQPIYDNVEYLLMGSGANKKYGISSCDELFESKIIEIEPIVYIRGRSIINQIMLIDEAQGLNNHEIKTIISRCGENTKIILTGDIDQIDNPYLTKDTSGLSIVVNKMQNHPLVGHLRLEKGERSALANLAVSCL